MKKSILFCCYGFGIGGIEKCLINLLNLFDTEIYDIDVLPMNPEDDLLPELNANVNLIDPFDYVMNTTDTMDAFKERKASMISYFKYIIFRLKVKFGSKPWKIFSAPSKKYDIAIAYAHTGYVPYYVIDCIKADKKYMWHHEGRYIKNDEYVLHKEYYPKFDNIICVSNDDCNIMKKSFPEIKEKFIVLYNVVNKAEIIKKSNESIEENSGDELVLTTVGRLSKQKGPDILLEVAKLLKENNINFKWYWIGDGDLFEIIKKSAEEACLSNNIALLGNKNNPYPYIKMCDIYVQPSYYEAYCTTTLEAQVLEKPIIVTDVCGMREQFVPNEDCLMTNIDAKEIFSAIKYLIDNVEECNRLKNNLHQKINNSNRILETYYDLLNS